MEEKYVALAIPFFFLLIGLELLIGRAQRKSRLYFFPDSITNLSCGVGQQVLGPFLKGATLAGYVWLFEHARVATVPKSAWWGWLVLFLGVDCAYYWFHRASHRINILWATHVVHHQSEEYNLSVALRQSWSQKVAESLFYLPLAVLGFAPEMFLGVLTIDVLYQFWIHTRTVKRGALGPLEWILNTPSHHRVHHGINEKYLDKNYGGILIVWDRLFGTFHAEEEEPCYGTVKPLASYNPLWANVAYVGEIASLSSRCARPRDKLYAWIAPPEWRPREEGGRVAIPAVTRATQKRYVVRAPRAVSIYVLVNFALVGAATTLFLWRQATTSLPALAIAAALILATLVAWGALLEMKRWAKAFELARLAAVVVAVIAWL